MNPVNKESIWGSRTHKNEEASIGNKDTLGKKPVRLLVQKVSSVSIRKNFKLVMHFSYRLI